MNNEEAKQLLIKYNAGLCTASEKAMLETWYLNYNEHGIDILPARIQEIGNQIYVDLPVHAGKGKGIKLWQSIVTIAAVLVLSVAAWTFFNKELPAKHPVYTNDIHPGSNKAFLILADGRKINLSESKVGVTMKGNTISYLDGSVIDKGDQGGLQTLTTPLGGQYHVILPEGTKVWLNAASSLTFPASFAGKRSRRVTLIGEAYFEVAKARGTKMPFIVTTNALKGGQAQEVEVLGTHFNINTYNHTSLKTTLLEGSVKVTTSNGAKVKLGPGDQSVVSNQRFEIKKIDTLLEVAWKNGKTAFEGEDIRTIMSTLALWYDIEVKYEGRVTDARFSGSVSRSKNISSVLKLLESTGDVHFKIQGKEITVMN